MYRFPENCVTENRNPLIPLEEKRSKVTIENSRREILSIVRIDGCVVTDNSLRCDYLMINENEYELFIELKGHDVEHAMRQLSCSVSKFSKKRKNIKLVCLVVTNRCPIGTTEIQKYKLYFKRKYDATLNISRNCSWSI